MGGGLIQGLGYLAVEVSDLDAARAFYTEGLGFAPEGHDRWPGAGASALLRAGSQHLFLVHNREMAAPGDSGVHQAYRVPATGRESLAQRLDALGFTVARYAEEHPAEAGDNFYVADPSGNRVQLVAANGAVADAANGPGDGAAVTGIDHACVEDYDMQWAEEFYSHLLGLPVAYWHGLRTIDYVHAQDWEAGRRDLAPGCCRMVRYYREVPGQNRMQARPTLQVYLRAGSAFVGVYMAMEDYAEPPEEQLRGDSCLGFSVAPGGLDALAGALESAGRKFIGPVDQGIEAPLGRSIYTRDNGGNFLAFSEHP
jgi:catechol 2,3-dioxygenase-like lactoylglutathione lyase family enzyme